MFFVKIRLQLYNLIGEYENCEDYNNCDEYFCYMYVRFYFKIVFYIVSDLCV